MPPLRQAMSLVDRNQRQGNGLKRIQNIGLEKRLRRRVKNVDFTRTHILPKRPSLVRQKIGIESFSPHARLTQGGYLIDHQRDQGRNDQPHAVTGERRDLVTKRLPAPGRHQYESIVARHHMPNDFSRLPTKRIVAIDGLEDLHRIGGHGGFLLNWTVGASWPNPGLSQCRKSGSNA